jgi:hypothetical protein
MLHHLILVSIFVITALWIHTPAAHAQSIQIPSLSDWQTIDPATHSFIKEGEPGDWDLYFWGAFANHLVKAGSQYLHYYQGADGYDEGTAASCESVTNRAIGLASGPDGLNWTKYPGNPVITWRPNPQNIEEGAVSTAPWVDPLTNTLYLYYGANTDSGTCLVNASINLAVSTDGYQFTDLGQVLSGAYNPNVWGSGDEIFPLGAYHYQNTWHVFYTPNGVSQARKLGVASGQNYDQLTAGVRVNNGTIPAWGSVSVVLSGNVGYLFTNPDTTSKTMNIYTFDPANPASITLIDTQLHSDCNLSFAVLYDQAINSWFLNCRQQFSDTGTNPPVTKLRYITKAVLPPPSPTSTPSTLGDTDSDGDVDLVDYQTLLDEFNTTNCGGSCVADFDNDGSITIFDFNVVVTHFGQ